MQFHETKPLTCIDNDDDVTADTERRLDPFASSYSPQSSSHFRSQHEKFSISLANISESIAESKHHAFIFTFALCCTMQIQIMQNTIWWLTHIHV